MDKKIKHLEFIQGIINRMAANSFFIKGWCITLVAALFALSSNNSNIDYFIISFMPVLIFWILDGYYLWQERLFRALYDYVRVEEDNTIDFSMKVYDKIDKKLLSSKKCTFLDSIFSTTLNLFYIPLIVSMLIIIKLLLN